MRAIWFLVLLFPFLGCKQTTTEKTAAIKTLPVRDDMTVCEFRASKFWEPLQSDEPVSYKSTAKFYAPGSLASSYNDEMDTILIKNVTMTLEARNCDSTNIRVSKIINSNRGQIVNSIFRKDELGQKSSHFSIKVPAARLEQAIKDLKSAGLSVITEHWTVEDQTENYVDAKARLRNKLALEKRYHEILSLAKTIKDVLEVEAQLNEIRSDIESAELTLRRLKRQSIMSEIQLTLNEAKPPSSIGLWDYIKSGFMNGVNISIPIIGAVVSLAVFILIFSPAIYGFILLQRKYKKQNEKRVDNSTTAN